MAVEIDLKDLESTCGTIQQCATLGDLFSSRRQLPPKKMRLVHWSPPASMTERPCIAYSIVCVDARGGRKSASSAIDNRYDNQGREASPCG